LGGGKTKNSDPRNRATSRKKKKGTENPFGRPKLDQKDELQKTAPIQKTSKRERLAKTSRERELVPGGKQQPARKGKMIYVVKNPPKKLWDKTVAGLLVTQRRRVPGT